MNIFFKKIKSQNSGFTLLELLISVSVFSLLVLVIAMIYASFNNSQLHTRASQQLLNNSQYALEVMAREIRKDKIVNFNITDVWCDTMLSNGLGLFSDCIFLEREDGQTVVFALYKVDTLNPTVLNLRYILLDCDDDYTSCDTSWSSTNNNSAVFLSGKLNNVNVSALDFIINPSTDPYIAGGEDLQPKVTIRLETEFYSTVPNEQVSQTLQTTISSRIYAR
ncbi:prepilin-type N-terminal cleavage/methylation domain-containing protein [Patescibacteria group bacterium]|nr:prepilin-type N-terminal cleavage/methylation domain-containing protein [Patescibacteria group bacterium]